MAEVTRKGDRIEIGDTVRVESGPALRRRKATDEALSNDATADHYQVGLSDALGKPIEAGAMFTYLDYYGPRVFYVYQRAEIGPDDPRFKAQPDGESPPLDEESTNIRAYTYVFEERGVFGTEDEAIEVGQKLASEE